MIEYFYTIDLGPTYGARLEALAEGDGFEDREAYLAMAVRDWIELRESCDRIEAACDGREGFWKMYLKLIAERLLEATSSCDQSETGRNGLKRVNKGQRGLQPDPSTEDDLPF